MKYVLRLDVDKPYGNHTFLRKVLSKFIEESNWIIKLPQYLDHVKWVIGFLGNFNVKAIFYFRNCTIPNQEILSLLLQEGHAVGFHAENTLSFTSFENEIATFEKRLGNNFKLHSFTKHGSGMLKLGKYHHAPYEPENYLLWAQEIKTPFYFGNDVFAGSENNNSQKIFFKESFWIEKQYRDQQYPSVESLKNIHIEDLIVPIISHPENLRRESGLQEEFKKLCEQIETHKDRWLTPDEFKSLLGYLAK